MQWFMVQVKVLLQICKTFAERFLLCLIIKTPLMIHSLCDIIVSGAFLSNPLSIKCNFS